MKLAVCVIVSWHLSQTFGPIVITGIKHIDNEAQPVDIHLVEGGVGHSYVQIEIASKRGQGINSTFVFYTENA